MEKKVMVAMSGGVDSSVAALLLVQQGYEVSGATLKLYDNQDIGIASKTCCSLADVEDARNVAYKLGFDHFVFNFGDHFHREVIERFANSYVEGETPNPCIDCNRYIKFSRLLQRAELLEKDYIATGHYARREYDTRTGRFLLKKAIDPTKDQSYVLYSLTQKELAKTLFPLGELTKSQVREIAAQSGLVNAEKPDSQDICFVKNGDYADFLENIMGVENTKGEFIDSQQKVLGQHKGFVNYTIGQRKGLGLSFDSPKYVIKKDKTNKAIVLGNYEELLSAGLIARDVNLISIEKLDQAMEVTVKTRYKQKEVEAVISPLKEGCLKLMFRQRQAAVTPGQAVVFYQGDIVIGGGTISKAIS